MITQPLISVITITFNASATLPITMKSVSEQTFQDFEHLIIDGASHDDTILIARQMGRQDVKIVSEPDNGLYDAMNKGLRIARGQYVIFLNSGDAFHSSDTLQLYADAIKGRPRISSTETQTSWASTARESGRVILRLPTSLRSTLSATAC